MTQTCEAKKIGGVSALLIACALMSACVSNPARELGKDRALEKALANPATQLSTWNHTVLRVGGQVGAVIGFGTNAVQVSVDCDSGAAHYLYMISPRHLYPNRSVQYAPPAILPVEVSQRVNSLPEIISACRGKPDWQLAKPIDAEEGVAGIAIDVGGLQELDNGRLVLWVAFDYPSMAYDPPYNAPYGVKYEKYELDCKAATGKVLAAYDVDEKANITDGLSESAEGHKPFAPDDDLGPVAREICLKKAGFSGLSAFVPTKKSFPDTRTVAPVDRGVLQKIVSSGFGSPAKRIVRYEVSGTTTYEGKTKPAKQVIEILPTSTIGLWRTNERGEGFQSENYSFLGLFSLSSAARFDSSSSADSSRVTELILTGNWKDMPVGGKLSYRMLRKSFSSMVGGYGGKLREERCVIESEVAASTLYSTLSGSAKLIKCQDPEDEYKRVSSSYYLEDYGVFFNQGDSKNSFFYSNYRISNVEFGSQR